MTTRTQAKKRTAARSAARSKTAAAKKTPGKKPAAGKKTHGKKTAKKPAAKKAPRKKSPVTKSAARKKTAAKRPAAKASARTGRGGRKSTPKKLTKSQRRRFETTLLALRDRLTGQIHSLRNDSLTRQDSTNLQEEGTDAFERQLALNLVTSEHEAVFQIDEALRRLNDGTYGFCESCGCLIDMPRLEALPFVRMCVACQSEQERGGAGVRPFGARRRRNGF